MSIRSLHNICIAGYIADVEVFEATVLLEFEHADVRPSRPRITNNCSAQFENESSACPRLVFDSLPSALRYARFCPANEANTGASACTAPNWFETLRWIQHEEATVSGSSM